MKGNYKNVELTLGDFYEQFGSGFILRTYEERSLGIDNSLQGLRFSVRPWAGLAVKMLAGRQRRYWKHNNSWLTGGDIEWNIDEWFKGLQQHNTYVMLGFSYVNKYEKEDIVMTDPTHRLHLPRYVNAYDVRFHLQHRSFNVLAEIAMKTQDPSKDNGYIYRNGYVSMLSCSYSKRGKSLLLQAKRSTNMAFRSNRGMEGASSFINHMPAFTIEHTYNFGCTLSPMPRVLRESGLIKQQALTPFRKAQVLGEDMELQSN